MDKTQYEYKVEFLPVHSSIGKQDYLNAWGAEGWELVQSEGFTDGRQYVFKRVRVPGTEPEKQEIKVDTTSPAVPPKKGKKTGGKKK